MIENQQTTSATRSMIILDGSGDTMLAWDDDQDAVMREFIADKMKDGWSFFVVKPRAGGLLAPKRTPLKAASALADDVRSVSVGGDNLVDLLQAGVRRVQRAPGKIETTGRAKTVEAVAAGETVAVKPRRGG
jgi:hypothetical protein